MARFLSRRFFLLAALVSLALFSTTLAQDDNASTNTAAATTANDSRTTAAATTARTTPTAAATTNNNNNNNNTPSPSTDDSSPETTAAAAATTPTAAIITGGASATNDGGLTSAPSLTRAAASTRTYPPPSPPPVADAPFMHRSSAPEGTVFIAVGAVLGALGLAVLLWRGIVACLLHRSVERAAAAQHAVADKTILFTAPAPPFYQHPGSSAASREHADSPSAIGPPGANTPTAAPPIAGPPGSGMRRTNRGATLSATPSMTNLFFSPTAPTPSGTTAATTANLANPAGADRTSRYLPSGFYPVPAGGSTTNLTYNNYNNTLHPDSPRVVSGSWPPAPSSQPSSSLNPSPPESPHPHATQHPSTSSLGASPTSSAVNNVPGARAPSAFLDHLLADSPGALPPPVMPAQRMPGGHPSGSSYGSGRM